MRRANTDGFIEIEWEKESTQLNLLWSTKKCKLYCFQTRYDNELRSLGGFMLTTTNKERKIFPETL